MSENRTCSDADNVMRIRTRYLHALRMGMSVADATAHANTPDPPERDVGACAQAQSPAAPSPTGIVIAPSNSHERGESSAAPSALSAPAASAPPTSVSTENTDLPKNRSADRQLRVPDPLVFQSLLAQNFNAFSEFAFSVVRPGLLFKPNWLLEVLAEKLAQVACGDILRLIITVPPRSLKSLYASVALPAWFLGHRPWERVVVISYSDLLARSHANDFRVLVNDPIYQSTFPATRLKRDTDREITTTKRGKRLATSIEGTLTGLGGNLMIIDDPNKPGDSKSVMARSIEWYRSTLLSRGDDKKATRIVVVMQRVDDNDLVGYLLDQGGFEVLNLPAIAQKTESFDLGAGRSYTRQ
jgi:hypothetical protein